MYFTGKMFVHFMRTAFNPFMPNGISHRYQLEQSISVLRDVRWYFSFLFKCNRKVCKQTVETLIRRRILWCLIWVCTVCLCPTKRTLDIYGLKMQLFCYLIRVPEIWEVDCWNNLPCESDVNLGLASMNITVLGLTISDVNLKRMHQLYNNTFF